MTAEPRPRCEATVFRRDTYRRTGRGKHGFELHYTEGQCKRPANAHGYCWQHQYMVPHQRIRGGAE